MNKKNRKMAFYEIHKGRLAIDVQKAFEEIQTAAFKMGQNSELTLKIKIEPPEDADDKFGKVAYNVSTKLPSKKSIKFTTELMDGLIVADGDSQIDVLQNELDFPEPMKLAKKSNGE